VCHHQRASNLRAEAGIGERSPGKLRRPLELRRSATLCSEAHRLIAGMTAPKVAFSFAQPTSLQCETVRPHEIGFGRRPKTSDADSGLCFRLRRAERDIQFAAHWILGQSGSPATAVRWARRLRSAITSLLVSREDRRVHESAQRPSALGK
jgi:hypothetical protein